MCFAGLFINTSYGQSQISQNQFPIGISGSYGLCFDSKDSSAFCSMLTVTIRYNGSGEVNLGGDDSQQPGPDGNSYKYGLTSYVKGLMQDHKGNSGVRGQATGTSSPDDYWDTCCTFNAPSEANLESKDKTPKIKSNSASANDQRNRADVGNNFTLTLEGVARLSIHENLGWENERAFFEPFLGAGVVFVSEGEFSPDRPNVAAVQDFEAPALSYGMSMLFNFTDTIALLLQYRGYVFFPGTITYEALNPFTQQAELVDQRVRNVSVSSVHFGFAYNF